MAQVSLAGTYGAIGQPMLEEDFSLQRAVSLWPGALPDGGTKVEPHVGRSSAATKDIFSTLFEAIGSLFSPQRQAGQSPQAQAQNFDLGKLLGDIAETVKGVGGAGAGAGAPSAGAARSRPEAGTLNGRGEVETGTPLGAIGIGPRDGVKGIPNLIEARTSGRVDLGGGTTAYGAANAGVFAGGQASAGVTFGPDGLVARAGAEVGVGARAHVEGGVSGDWGSISGWADAEVQLYAKAAALLQVNEKGLLAQASAEAGGLAGAAAGGAVNLGPVVRGKAKADAKSGAGAAGTATVSASFDPPKASVVVKGEAFAGARASFDAEGTIAGIGYRVSAAALAGVGAKFQLEAVTEGSKTEFSFCLGVAVGVGVELKCGFSFDSKDLGSICTSVVGVVGSVFELAGGLIGAVCKPIGKAIDDLTKPIGDLLGGLFGAVGSLFGGKPGNGALADELIAHQAKNGGQAPTVMPAELSREGVAC